MSTTQQPATLGRFMPERGGRQWGGGGTSHQQHLKKGAEVMGKAQTQAQPPSPLKEEGALPHHPQPPHSSHSMAQCCRPPEGNR